MTFLARGKLAVILILLTTVFVSCGKRDDPDSALAGGAVAKSELIDDAFTNGALADSALKTLGVDPAAKPMNISVEVDKSKWVRELIGPEGGTLKLIGPDSTRFTLEIPKKALLRDTIIEMTPVISLDGLKFSDRLVGAVQLKPDGLMLAAPAMLTIEPTKPVPAKDQIAFGSKGDGHDVHLIPLTPGIEEARAQLLHFSVNGSAQPAPGAIQFEGGSIKWTEGYWPMPTTPHDRYMQEFSKAVREQQILEMFSYDPDGQVAQDAARIAQGRVRAARILYLQDVVRRLKAAEADCSNREKVGTALTEYMAFVRSGAQIIGENAAGPSAIDQLASNVVRRCKTEALERCRAGEVLGGINMVEFERTFQILGVGEAYTDDEWSELKKCQPKWRGTVTYTHTVDYRGKSGGDDPWVAEELGVLPWTDGFIGTNTVKVEFYFWGKSGSWSGTGRIADDESDCYTVTSSISGQGRAKLSISDARSGKDWDPNLTEDLPGVGVEVGPNGSYSIGFTTDELIGRSWYTKKGGKNCEGARSSEEDERHSVSQGAEGQLDSGTPNVISGSKKISRNEGGLTISWDLRFDPEGKDR